MMDAWAQCGGKSDSTSHLMDWQPIPYTASDSKIKAQSFVQADNSAAI